MKRFLFLLLAVSFVSSAFAGSPEEKWHKGFYIATDIGMMQITNDRHAVTKIPFDSKVAPLYGLTLGWDITDWIGPMLEINFATTTGTAGDPVHGGEDFTYPGGFHAKANTFPAERAREYALDFGLYLRATLPYFTEAAWQGENLKFVPYLKLGGLGHGLFVNAKTNNDKIAAFGGGLGFGAGMELFIWKGIIFDLDAVENIIFQQGIKKKIEDFNGVEQNVDILEGGTKAQFRLVGKLGFHF